MSDFAEEETTHPGPVFPLGAEVANYRVIELCAVGGFGSVYRAEHKVLGRVAALKVLHPQFATSRIQVQRFVQEAMAVNKISHPNIVDIFDVGTFEDGRPYFFMEWLEGQTLEQLVRAKGPLSPPELVAVMEELCGALTVAHDAQIVHRDLKDTNVIAIPKDQGFSCKLVDFGIAKMLDAGGSSGRGLTSTGVALGTPPFMAPEQFLAEPVDRRTDIYALGVLLFKIATGRLPFQSQSFAEIQVMHLTAEPPAASQFAALPPAFDAVIARCMEKDPARRFQTADEVIVALRRAATEPRSANQAAPVSGLGLYVAARIDLAFDEPTDDQLDDSDRVLEEAREACLAAGLRIVLDTGTSMLGVVVLPSDGEEARARRRSLLESARVLHQALCTNRVAGVFPIIAVHAGPVLVQPETAQLMGGALLDIGDWTEALPEMKLVCSTEFLDGIEAAVPTGAAHGRFRVVAGPA